MQSRSFSGLTEANPGPGSGLPGAVFHIDRVNRESAQVTVSVRRLNVSFARQAAPRLDGVKEALQLTK